MIATHFSCVFSINIDISLVKIIGQQIAVMQTSDMTIIRW